MNNLTNELLENEQLAAEAREISNTYFKEYYQRNREKIRADQKAYRKAHPEKVKEWNRQYWLRKALKKRLESQK